MFVLRFVHKYCRNYHRLNETYDHVYVGKKYKGTFMQPTPEAGVSFVSPDSDVTLIGLVMTLTLSLSYTSLPPTTRCFIL